MVKRWQTIAHAGLVLRINIGSHHPGPPWETIEDYSPRIDDHAVPVCLAPIHMIPALGRCHDICEIFDRASTNQCSS